MLCLLRLRTELSIKAKEILMMQEAGFDGPADPEGSEKLAECAYLERSIGKTGKLALLPLLHSSSCDAWQLQLLKGVRT